MLKIDKVTSIHSRGQSAYFFVELDLDKLFVPKIIARGRELPLEYHGLLAICLCCGKCGHQEVLCSEKRVEPPTVQGENG